MLSEGFDSRLVAAIFRKVDAKVFSFTHGTPGTFGTHISEVVANRLGLSYHFADLRYPCEPAGLRQQLYLADNLDLPFFISGCEYFRNSDVTAVTCGTALDSTLGGKIFYKSSNDRLQAIFQRYHEIIRQNLGMIKDDYIEDLSGELIKGLLDVDTDRLTRRIKSRFIGDVADELVKQVGSLRESIEQELNRINLSGSISKSLQLQRFLLENKARKYAFGQELTIRTQNKIVVPSYERTFMKVASLVPVKHKLHHGVYLKLLKRYYLRAAQIATGNYFLPATFPRIALESSRFIGKTRDLYVLKKFLKQKGHSDYRPYRGAVFTDLNGRDESVFAFFAGVLEKNKKVLNAKFYHEYLSSIRNYQVRVYDYSDFYQAIEYSQVLQHEF
jgi:hypothetical protein